MAKSRRCLDIVIKLSPFRLPKALSADDKMHQLFVFAQQSIQAILAARLGTGKSPPPLSLTVQYNLHSDTSFRFGLFSLPIYL